MNRSRPTYISRQVRGRGRGRGHRPSQYLFQDDHHRSVRAVHGEVYPSRNQCREPSVSCPPRHDRNTYHGDYAEVVRWSAVEETMSARRLGVARRCGGTLLEAREHGTCSHHGRQLRSASGSLHRVAGCHHAGRYRFLRAPVPIHALSVPFLVPSPGHGALVRAHVRGLHNCQCQVPSVDGYGFDWSPWSWWANESVMPVAAVWAVVAGREVVRKHWSDAHVVRVLKYGIQVDIHGTWET